MKSHIPAKQPSGLLKVTFAVLCCLSLVLSSCSPKAPEPTATPAPLSETATPPAEELLPTDTLEPLLTEEPLPTDQGGLEIFSTEESGLILPLPTGQNGLIEPLPTDPNSLGRVPTGQTGTEIPLVETLSPENLPTDDPNGFVMITEDPSLSELPTEDPSLSGVPTADLNGNLQPTDSSGFPQTSPSQPTFSSNDAGILEVTPEPVATQPVEFKATPAGVPVGDASNPLMLGVVVGPGEGENNKLDSSQQLASQLSQATGYTIAVQPVNSYIELLNGMQLGSIHMAWLQPFSYILASRRGYAKVLLLTNHYGVYAYGAQFLANSKTGFTPYFDTNTNKSTASAADALTQFAGRRPCYVDPLSASGYIAPAGALAAQNLPMQPPLYLQTHTAVVRALYVTGICDFGATFAVYGDPRTSASIQRDLPDIMQKVMVIWQTGPVIPNLNFSVNPVIPDAITKKIAAAMDDLVLGEDGRQLLTSATNYEIRDLKAVDDAIYNPLRDMVKYSRVNLKTLVGK